MKNNNFIQETEDKRLDALKRGDFQRASELEKILRRKKSLLATRTYTNGKENKTIHG